MRGCGGRDEAGRERGQQGCGGRQGGGGGN